MHLIGQDSLASTECTRKQTCYEAFHPRLWDSLVLSRRSTRFADFLEQTTLKNRMANQATIEINRPLVGILAFACFIGAAVVWGFDLEQDKLWRAGFIRVGMLMSAFFIALPKKGRAAAWANVSPWTFAGLILAVFAIARFPKVAISMLIVLAVIHFVFRPRQRHSRPTQ